MRYTACRVGWVGRQSREWTHAKWGWGPRNYAEVTERKLWSKLTADFNGCIPSRTRCLRHVVWIDNHPYSPWIATRLPLRGSSQTMFYFLQNICSENLGIFRCFAHLFMREAPFLDQIWHEVPQKGAKRIKMRQILALPTLPGASTRYREIIMYFSDEELIDWYSALHQK